ncbi:NYN domain-containing protein [Alkalibacter mobilis]|uniref:NYN domain-containing protein n=1 Tax=Alkalibacter mobilis TaxID=2787712 RepID=UPI00189C939E|nr:NYN domain-containing protein [Alkalibacter mobilis]
MGLREHYLVVDGYNLINHWEKLRNLMEHSLEDARKSLIDLMQSYAKLKNLKVVLVFDAYNNTETAKEEETGGIMVVYSAKNQTADSYIEKLIHQINPVHEITVATSDFMLQKMILSAGGIRISARELEKEVEFAFESNMKKIEKQNIAEKNRLLHNLDNDTIKKLSDFTQNENQE